MITTRILGKNWKVFKLKDEDYRKISDGVAVTDIDKREICISAGSCNLNTIIHEVFHAYHASLCLDSTNEITGDDYEEIYAEFVAKYSVSILENSVKILSKLEKSKNNTLLNKVAKLLTEVEKKCL